MTDALIQARDGRAVRGAGLWTAMAARLTTPEVLRILNGGRVYRASEDYSREERTDGQPWGRDVLVPVETLWPGRDVEPGWRGLNWLVRSEMRGVAASGYDVLVALERLQQSAYEQLQDWAPTAAEVGAQLVRPIWRERGWQGMPEWDAERRLWWLSSEFRAELTLPA